MQMLSPNSIEIEGIPFSQVNLLTGADLTISVHLDCEKKSL